MRAGERGPGRGHGAEAGPSGRAGLGRPDPVAGRRGPGWPSSRPATSWSNPDQMPGPGQIRNSNAIMLQALADRGRAPRPRPCRSRPDEPDALQADPRAAGSRPTCCSITGGVSAGQRDLVPEALERPRRPSRLPQGPAQAGQAALVRRGRPGAGADRTAEPGALVFGLPGNPVSGLVGFLLFVRPALAVLADRPGSPPVPRPVRLARPFRHRGDRPTYSPGAADLRLGARPGTRPRSRPSTGPARPTCGPSARPTASPPSPPATAITRRGEIVGFPPMR